MKVTSCVIRKDISPRVVIRAFEFHIYFPILHLGSTILKKSLSSVCHILKVLLSWWTQKCLPFGHSVSGYIWPIIGKAVGSPNRLLPGMAGHARMALLNPPRAGGMAEMSSVALRRSRLGSVQRADVWQIADLDGLLPSRLPYWLPEIWSEPRDFKWNVFVGQEWAFCSF